jgi:probable O-glycosylation ligase (exosortase A-associated)
VTVFATLFSKETQKIPVNSITVVWIIYIGFMGVTTLNAFFPEDAGTQYLRVIKIQFFVFLTMILINNLTKLNHLLAAIVFSIGFYSVKGGVFTVLTGGSMMVWGPPESFIEGNNELAVASLMTIPLMAYLYQISKSSWMKKILIASMALSFIAAIGTQSRGALVAFAAVALFFWIKSQKKLVTAVLMAFLSMGIYAFMPSSWHKRMDTIETYDQDASAMGRLNAWEYAYNAANHHLLGMGYDSWSPITFAMYAPIPEDVHAAHSIYFSVLADHGWIGLFLFLMILFLTWRTLSAIVKSTHQIDGCKEINALAVMLQISLIAYLVGGAFLSLAYFDLPWHVISFVVILKKFAADQIKANLATAMDKNATRANA